MSHRVEKFRVEKSGDVMYFKLIVRGHSNPRLFNPELSNPMVQKLMVEKFMIEKSGVERSRVEKSGVENFLLPLGRRVYG